MQEDSDFWLLLCILGFDNLVRVAGEVFEQFLFCGVGIHAYPVFGRQVKRFADAVVLGFQFIYPVPADI